MATIDMLLLWSLPAAVALHNLEEALWLPGWSESGSGRWRRPVGAWAFRFAVTILTVAVFLLTALTQLFGWSSIWHYLLAGYALGQSLNVFFPHLLLTIATGRYMPGLLTGLFLVVPAAALFLYTSLADDLLRPERFLAVAAATIATTLLALPLLFRAGEAVREAVRAFLSE